MDEYGRAPRCEHLEAVSAAHRKLRVVQKLNLENTKRSHESEPKKFAFRIFGKDE
jgi:hypothetical protein